MIVENDPRSNGRSNSPADARLRLCEESLGRQARRTVEERFGWDSIAESQKRLYQDLLKS